MKFTKIYPLIFFLFFGILSYSENITLEKRNPKNQNETEIKSKEETPVNQINLYASIGSILVSLGLIYFSYKNTQKTIDTTLINTQKSIEANNENTIKTLNSKKTEERKNEIYKKLNEFYGPFYQLRSKSKLLYIEFSEKFKKDEPNKNFRTLTFLLDNGVIAIPENEKILLNEIINIGEKCENLIHDKAGLIDDEELRTVWFPKASTHYLLIRLAYQGSLSGDSLKYSKYTFPTEIDTLIERRIKALQLELETL
jgi:hypothetical protein